MYWYSRYLCSINGGPSAKICSSVKFFVLVFKASILDSLGGPLAIVGLSANFGVLVFKASLLYYLGGICQVLFTGNQGIYSQFTGVHWVQEVHMPILVYWYSRHLCCITQGDPSAKLCLSAMFCVLVFKASMLY